MFIQGFNFELDINALPRAEQFVALMEAGKNIRYWVPVMEQGGLYTLGVSHGLTN